jgi:hypothetical protein
MIKRCARAGAMERRWCSSEGDHCRRRWHNRGSRERTSGATRCALAATSDEEGKYGAGRKRRKEAGAGKQRACAYASID